MGCRNCSTFRRILCQQKIVPCSARLVAVVAPMPRRNTMAQHDGNNYAHLGLPFRKALLCARLFSENGRYPAPCRPGLQGADHGYRIYSKQIKNDA